MNYMRVERWKIAVKKDPDGEIHSKKRAYSRFALTLTPDAENDLIQTLEKGEHIIQLSWSVDHNGPRYACYFRKKWYLIGCRYFNGTMIVATFLELGFRNAEDERILAKSSLYHDLTPPDEFLIFGTPTARKANKNTKS